MNKSTFEKLVTDFLCDPLRNKVSKEDAIDEGMIGLLMFDNPIFGYANAKDPLFNEFHDDKKITNNRFMTPCEWMEDAKSVVSIFAPFTKEVRESNRGGKLPSHGWLHARFEGQNRLRKLSCYIKDDIEKAGYNCVVPGIDSRIEVAIGHNDITHREIVDSDYGCNWSERHVAFAAGLGTFGLSRGIITRKGMAGRFASVICDIEFEPTKREYTDVYEYCTMCGACIRNCPVETISFEKGKGHEKCSKYLEVVRNKFSPRYACGKCQVGVPCESGIPRRKAR
jgi:epoxyqueuosine reductase QueG